MPLSTEIRLPREHGPRFPDLCCRCLAPAPDTMLRCASRVGSWFDYLMPWLWLFRRPFRCEVPICSGCRSRVVWHRRLRVLALIAVAMVVIPWVTTWSKQYGWSRQWRKLATLGAFLVAGAPVLGWFVWRPLAFDLTVRKHDVDYEFASAAYAMAFHLLNPQGHCDDWVLPDTSDDGSGPGA